MNKLVFDRGQLTQTPLPTLRVIGPFDPVSNRLSSLGCFHAGAYRSSGISWIEERLTKRISWCNGARGCSGGELDGQAVHSGSETAAESDDVCDDTASHRAVQFFGTRDKVETCGDAETAVELLAEATVAPTCIGRFSYSGDLPGVIWSHNEKSDELVRLIVSVAHRAAPDPRAYAGDSSWWAANEHSTAWRVEASWPWELTVLPVDAPDSLAESFDGTRAYLYDGLGGAFSGTKPGTGVRIRIIEVSLRS